MKNIDPLTTDTIVAIAVNYGIANTVVLKIP